MSYGRKVHPPYEVDREFAAAAPDLDIGFDRDDADYVCPFKKIIGRDDEHSADAEVSLEDIMRYAPDETLVP